MVQQTIRPGDPRHSSMGKRCLAWLDRHLTPIVQPRAWKRLNSSIAAYRQDLDGRTKENCKLNADLAKIKEALEGAERSLLAGDIDGGWKGLHTARRLELLTFDDAHLNAVSTAMRAEAEKLDSWRKTAVVRLLDESEKLESARVFHAAALRDEHYDNEAHKSGLRGSSTLWLSGALGVGLLALFILASNGVLLQTLQSPNLTESKNVFNILLTVAVFGVLGAIVSAAISLPGRQEPMQIPELLNSFRVTALRLFVGPVSAIVAFFVAQSNAFKAILHPSMIPDGYTILIVAFVAGFTERLVLRVAERVAGRTPS